MPASPPIVEPPPRQELLGDSESRGQALNTFLAPSPQVGRRGDQAQAAASLDPAGLMGADSALSDASSFQKPQRSVQRPLASDGPRRTTQAPPIGAGASISDLQPVPGTKDKQDSEISQTSQTTQNDSDREQQARKPATPQPAESGQRASGARARPPGDPYPQADSEVDPFSTVEAVEFRRGSTIARTGRKYRVTRPRLNLSARVDFLALSRVEVVLRLHLDASGNVRKVDVVKSSGSNEIDQPTKIAAYDWWFEPFKDAEGNPRPGTLTIPIRFF